MTKLTLLIVLAVAVAFVAHTCCASKQQERESCSEELRGVNLGPCKKHVMERIQGCGGDDDGDDDFLAVSKGKGQVEKCCSEMRELQSSKCQCRALQKIMEEQGESVEKKKEMMEKEVMYLAVRCGFGPMVGCDLRSDH